MLNLHINLHKQMGIPMKQKSIKQMLTATLLILITGLANSTATPNDVGLTSNPVLSRGGTVIVAGGFTAGSSPTQVGRLNRDGVQSTCGGKAYPGIFDPGTTYHYEQFELFNNSSNPVCVTIEFNPDTPAAGNECGVNAHISAYVGSYDPANQGVNFIGDVGSSTTQPFSFEVPANSNVILEVNTTNGGDPLANCNFEFGYSAAELSAAGPAPTAVPTLSTMGLMIFILGFLSIVFFKQRNSSAK
jgi:hypothetical protein